MRPETWPALIAGALLVAAAVARILALLHIGLSPRHWDLLVLGARASALPCLLGALGPGLVARSTCAPLTPGQISLAISLVAVVLHLAFWRRYRFDGAGPAVDLLAAGLVAMGLAAGRPAGPALSCALCSPAYQVQQTLFLIGAGGVTELAASALMLVRHMVSARDGDPPSSALVLLSGWMKEVTALTMLVLGSGLLTGAWRAWLAVGEWAGGDAVMSWLAVTWLLVANSGLAWRLAGRGRSWAAAWAILAAATAGLGLLAADQLPHLLGF